MGEIREDDEYDRANRERASRSARWRRGLAGSIASATGGDADAIYKELAANAIPNSRMAPAGVLAVNRAQEYGYTLPTAL